MSNDEKKQEFIVTARKWRPLRFSDVIGQQHISTTLKNAIATNRIHHAYLFCGPRGVGKTTTARILARAVNCENPTNFEPCNRCESCTSVLEGKSLDIIEIDGASNNSVDDIRKLRENAKYPPSFGKYKMYIIDEVHMLSTSAFNALLKTLEEPPPHLLFVFATTESHKLPATIISRCQRFDFRRMEINEITSQLRMISANENISIDENSLVTIAKKADGSMRDGQSIFDRIVAFCGTNIVYSEMAEALHLIDQEFYFRISSAIKNKNISYMFEVANEVIRKGYDLQECMQGLLEHFRNILTIKATNDVKFIESSESFIEKYKSDAEYYTQADLLRILNLVSTTELSLKYSPQPRIKFELGLVQLASMDSALDLQELLNEIKLLKSNPNFSSASKPNSDKTLIENKFSTSTNVEKKNDLKLENNNQFPTKEINSMNVGLEETTQNKNYQNIEDNKVKNSNSFSKEIQKIDNLSSSWSDFKIKLAASKYGSMMLDMVEPDFLDSLIVLKTDDNFIFDNVSKKKAIIQNELNEYYHKNISLKIIKVDEDFSKLINKNQDIRTDVEIFNSEANENKDYTNGSSINIDEKSESIIDNINHNPISKNQVEQKIIDLFDTKQIFN